ncbi:hypothetical protein SCLARK_00227 [Spiroplasma clarkii]|nr:hypothetical protein SCLARK_00227 [Spiroplasma clarkii]
MKQKWIKKQFWGMQYRGIYMNELNYFARNYSEKAIKQIAVKYDTSIQVLNTIKENYKLRKSDVIYNISSFKEANLVKNQIKVEKINSILVQKKLN